MSIDEIFVAVFSLSGIVFTYWFFLMKKEDIVSVTDTADIIVEGGYNPDVISVPQGKKTIINFIRKDTSSCLEEVVLPDFKIRKFLPVNQKVSVEINPQKKGEYGYACGMNMFHGKIIVT